MANVSPPASGMPHPRNSTMLRLTLAACLALPVFAVAQDAPVKAQRSAAADAMKRVGADKPAVVETAAVLLTTTLPESKAAALAAAAQKGYDAAVKLLKVTEPAKLWPGKLTAFVLPVRNNYSSFVRLIANGRPEAAEFRRVNPLTDAPFVLVGVEPGTTPTDAGLAETVSRAAAEVVLRRQFGNRTTATPLPYWLTEGFDTVAVARADGNGAKLAALRAKQRAVFSRRTLGTFKVGDVWGKDRGKNQDVIEAAFVEFLLADGDGTFEKFAGAFKPGEGNRVATTADALDAVMWKDDAALDGKWKTWVLKSLAR